MSVRNRLLKTREKSGDRNEGGVRQIGGFLLQPAGKLPSLGKYDPGNAAKVRGSWGQKGAEGELLGELWLAQGAAFPYTPHSP